MLHADEGKWLHLDLIWALFLYNEGMYGYW